MQDGDLPARERDLALILMTLFVVDYDPGVYTGGRG